MDNLVFDGSSASFWQCMLNNVNFIVKVFLFKFKKIMFIDRLNISDRIRSHNHD